jgi:hydrophobic/amphiphilic exporter-1 (mainly G- bacteria), HAE1 family
MSITELSIKRPSLVIVTFMVLVLGGIIGYTKLGYELFPNFSEPIVTITTLYPGASPPEVENKVTKKVEDAVAGLENISEVTSKSMENMSLVIVTLKAGANINLAMQDAQRKVQNIKADLPTDAKSPMIAKVSPSDSPFMQLSATSNLSDREFYDLVDDKILPQLQQIKGVAQITLLGGEQREIRINANQDKLRLYGISLLQLNAAIAGANIDLPTGKVKTAANQITVRLAGKFASMDDIRNLALVTMPNPSGGTSIVHVGDVAEVTDGVKDVASVSRYNGKNGIGLQVKKQSDGNAVAISHEIKAKIAEIERLHAGAGVKFTIAGDNTDFTMESVHAVQHDLVIAIVLVAAVMLLFLHSFRNAVIVMVSIPASLISTFIAMAVFGFSLNLMTLLAMSLVIGILVDDSIVVLENIQRHLEMGKNKVQAAIDGRSEIGFSAMAITLVDVVVFLPIVIFVNTTIGDILRQFATMIVVSTLMSLFVSFTVTPWLASRFGQVSHLNPANPFHRALMWFESLLDALTAWYGRRLEWALNHKLVSTAIVLACFGGLAWVMSLGILGEELVSQGDQGKFLLKLEYDKSVTLTENALRTKRVEDLLLTKPEVASIFSNIGGPLASGGTGQGSPNVSELTMKLVPASDRALSTEKYMIALRQELARRFAGVKFASNVIGLKEGGAPIELVLTGANYESLIATGKNVKARIAAVPGANDVQMSVEDGMPELNLTIDREKMATLGLDMINVGMTLNTAFAGNDNSKFRTAGNEYDIRIMMDAFDRQSAADLANMTFTNNRGQQVKLAEFATVTQNLSPSQLERKDRAPSLSITAYNLGTSTGKVSDAINGILAQKDVVPSDVNVAWGGDTKRTNESMGALFSALIIGLLCVYLIMVALYDNFVYPFVVLFSIPVALIGAFLALNFAMSTTSVFTMLGIIMLLGLVAKNAILIVDFTNQLKSEGYGSYDALVEAGKTRLRPIIMTTVAMVAGMFPIAVAKGAGAEWKNGLGLVLLGGLTSSMLLTVFVVPMAYLAVDKVAARFKFRSKTTSNNDDTVPPQNGLQHGSHHAPIQEPSYGEESMPEGALVRQTV